MNKNTPAALALLLLLALSGCASERAEEINKLTPDQLAQASDLDMCKAWYTYGYSHTIFTAEVEPSGPFVNEFNRRGLICHTSFGTGVTVAGYTQERLDANEDVTCRSYGIAPATPAYANCHLQLRAQRIGAAQTQQVIQAQQDPDRAAAWRNLSTTGAMLMQQSKPPPPAPYKMARSNETLRFHT